MLLEISTSPLFLKSLITFYKWRQLLDYGKQKEKKNNIMGSRRN